MHLSHLSIENFRIFGARAQNLHLDLPIRPGVTLLVGENDSGKTAILDALRLVLGTTSQDYLRVTDDDFHMSADGLATAFSISCRFSLLSVQEAGRFVEWLTTGAEPTLDLTLRAVKTPRTNRLGANIEVTEISVRSGRNGEGKAVDGDIRSFLRSTYLKALRDAEMEMAAGRGSRLSQLLLNHPNLRGQELPSELPPPIEGEQAPPPTLRGIMMTADDWIIKSKAISDTKDQLNDEYLSNLSVGFQNLLGEISIGRHTDLKGILEKLELWLTSSNANQQTRHGLGMNNLLFMAAELLLLSDADTTGIPLLLIEEPEAHLHPQMQLRLMEFLESKATQRNVQTILTTHSPTLASKADVESIVMMSKGIAYPMHREATKLAPGDYRFLRKFLDATKSNLFFAKAIIIVEGDAENILLPTFAQLLGKPLSKFGVSIVKVGHVGLFRYARIFQRSNPPEISIAVACIADRDIPPDCAKSQIGNRKTEGELTADKIAQREAGIRKNDAGTTRTFISEHWTLEYDLAVCGLARELCQAISEASSLRENADGPDAAAVQTALAEFDVKKTQLAPLELALYVFTPLIEENLSKAEVALQLSKILTDANWEPTAFRAKLAPYLVSAIDYVTTPLQTAPPPIQPVAAQTAPTTTNAN